MGTLTTLPIELLQCLQGEWCSLVAVIAMRATCRRLHQDSITDELYMEHALRRQFAARHANLADAEENVAAVKALLRLGFVVSGGMLLAMIHREIWPDSHDIDLFRPAHVQFIDEQNPCVVLSQGDKIGSARSLQATYISSGVPTCTICPHTASQLEATRQIAQRSSPTEVGFSPDWHGPSTLIVHELLMRHYRPGLRKVYPSDICPSADQPEMKTILRDDEGKMMPGGYFGGKPDVSFVTYVSFPGSDGLSLNLIGLSTADRAELPPMTDDVARGKLVVNHIRQFDLSCLRSMWTGRKVWFLERSDTCQRLATLTQPLNIQMPGSVFMAAGLPYQFERCARYQQRGFQICAHYEPGPREDTPPHIACGEQNCHDIIPACQTCLGPRFRSMHERDIYIHGSHYKGCELVDGCHVIDCGFIRDKHRVACGLFSRDMVYQIQHMDDMHSCSNWDFLMSSALINTWSVRERRHAMKTLWKFMFRCQ